MVWLVWLCAASSVLRCSISYSVSSGDSELEALCDIGTSSDGQSFSASFLDTYDAISGCHRDAYCQEMYGGNHICVCNNGFFGDGLTCTPIIQCPQPTSIRHGRILRLNGNRSQNAFFPGDSFRYICRYGYKMQSKGMTHTCGIHGNWTGKPPTCVVQNCGGLNSTILHGQSTATIGLQYKTGSTIHFSCDPGYVLNGKSWTVCLFSKPVTNHWSHPTPTCLEVRCPNLAVPENGNRHASPPFRVAQTVYFRCHSGYQLIGSVGRTCQDDGKWSGYPATCVNNVTDCPDPGAPVNGYKNGNSYRNGDTISFICSAGYGLLGSSKRTCWSGKWSGIMPVCRGKNEFNSPQDATSILTRAFDRITQEVGFGQATWGGNSDSCGEVTNTLQIFFLFDGSASIGEGNFHKEIEFAIVLTEKVDGLIGKFCPHSYGAIVYSNIADVKFYAAHSFNMSEVKERLKLITYPTAGGSGTAIALRAVRHMITRVEQTERNVNRVKRIIFLISDGKSNVGGSPIQEADLLRSKGSVEIFVIGIGSDVDTDEIVGIATPENATNHVFVLNNFDKLQEVSQLLNETKVEYSQYGSSRSVHKPSNSIHRPASLSSNIRPMHTSSIDGTWQWRVLLWPVVGQTIKLRRPFCSGSLISDQWVLTAADCFYTGVFRRKSTQSITERFIVGSGGKTFGDWSKTFKWRRAIEVIQHHRFNGFDNNIALIRLESVVNLSSKIHTVCLPNKIEHTLLPRGTPVVISSWKTNEGKRTKSKSLHQKEGTVVSQRMCQRTDVTSNRPSRGLGSGLACVVENGNADPGCTSPGSPIVTDALTCSTTVNSRWVQVGIASRGLSCIGDSQRYHLYTNVMQFRQWINNKTGI